MPGMDAVTAAQVWHYWIAVVLTAGAVVAAVLTVLLYIWRMQSMKHPRR